MLRGGALKPTADPRGSWSHVVCAVTVPEVVFGKPDCKEPVMLSSVPRFRQRLVRLMCRHFKISVCYNTVLVMLWICSLMCYPKLLLEYCILILRTNLIGQHSLTIYCMQFVHLLHNGDLCSVYNLLTTTLSMILI